MYYVAHRNATEGKKNLKGKYNILTQQKNANDYVNFIE